MGHESKVAGAKRRVVFVLLIAWLTFACQMWNEQERATAEVAAASATRVDSSATPRPLASKESPAPSFIAPPTVSPTSSPAPLRVHVGPGHIDAPILLYHRVDVPEYALSPYYVTPEHFEQQLALLKNWGYETISMDLLARAIREGADLPARPLVISFDDGQLSVYENAFPIMKKFGFTGILYLVGTYVDAQTFMTSAQVQEMVAAGWEIGSHSMSHSNLTTLESDQQFYELKKSRAILEEKIGAPVHSFAYPFGYYNDGLMNMMPRAGYSTAVGVGYTYYQSEWNLYVLQRRDVKGTFDLQTFAALLPWQGDEAFLPTVSPTP